MRSPRFPLHVHAAALALILLGAADAWAQPQLGNLLPNPRLNTVSPPGGKVGTTFEVTFTGTDLDVPEALLFSHPGIKATAVESETPKETPKGKGDKTKPAPQVAKFTVAIAPDVPVGNHDVRLVGKYGISNAR